ncbi:MAG: hypothetical protein J0H68_02105 [Sphingobacteriia bacterium]|nr:hypothetical protein [Sphingobacteriia bacterium]
MKLSYNYSTGYYILCISDGNDCKFIELLSGKKNLKLKVEIIDYECSSSNKNKIFNDIIYNLIKYNDEIKELDFSCLINISDSPYKNERLEIIKLLLSKLKQLDTVILTKVITNEFDVIDILSSVYLNKAKIGKIVFNYNCQTERVSKYILILNEKGFKIKAFFSPIDNYADFYVSFNSSLRSKHETLEMDANSSVLKNECLSKIAL